MPTPRYKVLVDRFKACIQRGELPPGTRLPTHRQLAAEQGVALATATRVYTELEAMGLVSGETGRGTFVREHALPRSWGMEQQAIADDVLDLNFNYPSLPGQGELLRAALRQLAASGDLDALLRYQPHAGRPHERVVAAQYLARQGVTVQASQVLIVNGAQQGLTVMLMGCLRAGDVVAADALTYSGFKVLAQALGIELLAIPVTPAGPDLDVLAQWCQQRPVKAVYCMPTLHNPLGWVLDRAQRERLVALAREHDLLLFEDAAYGYLAPEAPPALIALAPERTLYVTGLSKNIATGLRVGFVAAPPVYVPVLERMMRATTWNAPGIVTAIASAWLEDGTVQQLETAKREDARARQSIAREALAGLTCYTHPASYFLWLPLPGEARADQVANALMREGISVSTAEPFAIGAQVPHALRLALGSLPLAALGPALRRVRAVVEGAEVGVF